MPCKKEEDQRSTETTLTLTFYGELQNLMKITDDTDFTEFKNTQKNQNHP